MKSEELITISEFYIRLIDFYYIKYDFFIDNIKIQYKDYIKIVPYSNCVKGIFNLMSKYFYHLIKVQNDDDSVLIIIDDPEIYALLSLYLL